MCPALILCFLLLALPAAAQRLPTGGLLTPAGTQTLLPGTLALNTVRISGTPFMVAVCGGGLQALSVVDTHTGALISSVELQTANNPPIKGQPYTATGAAWYGLASFGRTVYAAQAETDTVGIYQVTDSGTLTRQGTLSEPTGKPKTFNFPAGLAVNGNGTRLYAANNLLDTLAIWNTETQALLGTVPVDPYPLAVSALPDGSKVYVTSERDGTVSVVRPSLLKRTTVIHTGSHPHALLLSPNGRLLYVANGGSDTLSVVDTQTDTVRRTLLLRPLSVRGLPGTTPTGLCLSPDGHTLFVTLADLNALAVLRLTAGGTDARLAGCIPTGWYPAAVCADPAGARLCIVNAKGSAARIPNASGAGPSHQGVPSRSMNFLLRGTVSCIPAPTPHALRVGTRQVLANNALSSPLDPETEANIALLQRLPIHHIIYIIKENRTYDQVLGDLGSGNGDPRLTLFGRTVTPNEHALASTFPLLDNFFCCADASADGWNWSTSGFANEYVQRTVAEIYGERKETLRPLARPYDYEGENRKTSPSLAGIPDVAESDGGYLWDAAVRHGVSVRNYGCFLTEKGAQPTKPALVGRTCPIFAPFAMNHADSDAWVSLHLPPPGQYLPRKDEDPPIDLTRYKGEPSRFTAWKAEWDDYVQSGTLPALEMVRLPRDHTAGTTVPLDSPAACVADNDYAVGEIVDTVSHSRYWKDTALFIVEDDAQNGPDHVDCHRSVCFVVSPYAVRGMTDTHFYNTDSVLRTMELLLHIPPMTRYDASAPPLGCFCRTPNAAPYTALVPDRKILGEKNSALAYGAAESGRMDFRQADAIPDAALNRILWRNARGKNAPLPPVRGSEER